MNALKELRGRLLLALVFGIALVGGCSGAAPVGTSTLDVVVKDVSMTVVAGATVTTTPDTKTLTTDDQGRAQLTNVAAGVYTVEASKAGIGVAKADVTVRAGDAPKVTLILRKSIFIDGGNDDAASTVTPDAGAQPDATSPGPDALGTDALPSVETITLAVPTKDSNGINLAWTTAEPFETFKIYRGNDTAGSFSVIDIINDPKARTYRDTTAALGTTYRYRVAGLSQGHADVTSNVQTITAGVFIAVNTQVERMKADPKRPYVYAIDKVNNGLLFIDTRNNTVEKTIFVGSTPTDIDLGLDGAEAFVANSGSTEISVIDLTTRTKSRSILVDGSTTSPTSGYVARLACLAGNVLAYSSAGASSYLKLINGTTGATIPLSPSVYIYSDGRFAASPDGARLYVSGSYSVYRYDIVGTMVKQADVNSDYNSYYSSPIARSGDGMYVFAGNRKLLANNLKSVLGTFGEPILVSNATGALAVGAMRIYDGTTFAVKAPLPLTTQVMTLGADDKTLYLYHQNSSRIFLYTLP
jgi:YVTN family beta-propeller protein